MGVIIRTDGKQLVKKVLTKHDHKKFQYLIISEDIETLGKRKNVMSLNKLMPPPNVVAAFVRDGYCKDYKAKYLEYLKRDEVNSVVAVIVKAVLTDLNIILVCSNDEKEYKYLKLLGDFIESEYRVKVISYKEYDENPEKAEKIKNKEEVTKILNKKMEKFKGSNLTLDARFDSKRFKTMLSKLDKKELKAFCKSKKIKIDNDMSKEDIIKKITKKI